MVGCAPAPRPHAPRATPTVVAPATATAGTSAAPSPDEHPATAAPPASPSRAGETYRGEPLEALLRAMATRRVVRRVARFDSTTVVYCLELEGGLQIGFKPAVVPEPDLWRHEVAAYRLGRLLGLGDRVPPAVVRRVPLAALEPGTARDRVLPARDDPATVLGAATYWFPSLAHAEWHTPEAQSRWRAWLRADAALPPDAGAVAEQLATLLVFDYLEGNADRWSVYNLRADERGALIYRDNNGAWFAGQMARLDWQRFRLHQTQRFRRSLIDALERADAAALRAELARDPAPDGLVVGERHLAAYERRRQYTLEYARSLARRYGDAAVFAWP